MESMKDVPKGRVLVVAVGGASVVVWLQGQWLKNCSKYVIMCDTHTYIYIYTHIYIHTYI